MPSYYNIFLYEKQSQCEKERTKREGKGREDEDTKNARKGSEQQSDNCREENERTNYKYETNNRGSL